MGDEGILQTYEWNDVRIANEQTSNVCHVIEYNTRHLQAATQFGMDQY